MARQRDWTILTRATLLARLKDVDDHKSWTEFYNIYSRLIHSVARQRGLTETESEDVVVETIASAARHMPGFNYDRKLGSFKSWLLQMARWRIIDQYKKRQKLVIEHQLDNGGAEGRAESDLERMSASPDLDRLWNEEWEKCLLAKAVEKARRQLNPKHYQAYDLYVNKEWDAAKVAKVMAISVGQVYLAKHRVTEAIKEEVSRLQKEII